MVQTFFLLFFLLLPLANRLGTQDVIGTLASIRIGPISLVDPAAGVSGILASRTVHLSVLKGMILPVLLALALGPVFCSWVCPWGFFTEWIDRRLRRKALPLSKGTRKVRWSALASFLLLSFGLGTPLAATLSAPRLITTLPLEVIFLGSVSAGTISLLGILLLLELVLPRRLWCRALCPVGSVLTLIRWPKTLTIGYNADICGDNAVRGNRCFKQCPWNIDPKRMSAYDGCTNCATCIDNCPTRPDKSLGFTVRNG